MALFVYAERLGDLDSRGELFYRALLPISKKQFHQWCGENCSDNNLGADSNAKRYFYEVGPVLCVRRRYRPQCLWGDD